jgi:predicted Zn-dependent protease
VIGVDAKANVFGDLAENELAARRRLTVAEYESMERDVDSTIGVTTKDFDIPAFEFASGRKRLLVLRAIRNYVRSYEWAS